jgi:hypothetical protein
MDLTPLRQHSWKSTVAGLVVLAGLGVKIYDNPSVVQDPRTVAEIAAGVGLLVAKDHDKSGDTKVM